MSELDPVLAALRAAREAISAAEGNLDTRMADLTRAPRSEKTTISDALAQAFTQLRAARLALVALEQSMLPEDVERP